MRAVSATAIGFTAEAYQTGAGSRQNSSMSPSKTADLHVRAKPFEHRAPHRPKERSTVLVERRRAVIDDEDMRVFAARPSDIGREHMGIAVRRRMIID